MALSLGQNLQMLILCTLQRQDVLYYQEFRYGLILAVDNKASVWRTDSEGAEQRVFSKICRPGSGFTEYQLRPIRADLHDTWTWKVLLDDVCLRLVNLMSNPELGWSVGIFQDESSTMAPLPDFDPNWVDTAPPKEIIPTVWERLIL